MASWTYQEDNLGEVRVQLLEDGSWETVDEWGGQQDCGDSVTATIEGVEPETPYSVRVCVSNAYFDEALRDPGTCSNVVGVTTGASPGTPARTGSCPGFLVGEAPADVSVVVSGTSATLTWEDRTLKEVSYLVEYWHANDVHGATTIELPANSNRAVLTNLEPGMNDARVTAIDLCGNVIAAEATSFSVRRPRTRRGAPVARSAVSYVPWGMSVGWRDNSDFESKYLVYMRPEGGSWRVVDVANDDSVHVNLEQLEENAAYDFQVCGVGLVERNAFGRGSRGLDRMAATALGLSNAGAEDWEMACTSVFHGQTVPNLIFATYEGTIATIESVEEATACWTESVACGVEQATDAALCGWQQVTETVTNAAMCGWETVNGFFNCASCLIGVPNCSCEAPASCEVERDCDPAEETCVANTCVVTRMCDELVCED